MTRSVPVLVLIRGGGDLGSGIAVRLVRSGFEVVISELAEPRVVRRSIAFAEAVSEGQVQVEDITGQHIDDPAEIKGLVKKNIIPVLVDPELSLLEIIKPDVVVDARMKKEPPRRGKELATLVIGLGPGFSAGENCHAVIETNRGHNLGRVTWSGPAQQDTGIPGQVLGHDKDRVLRAPVAGQLQSGAKIGDRVKKGTLLALVGGQAVFSPFDGTLRGLMKPGSMVAAGEKIGDVDPRDDPTLCSRISDKSRAIGGAVLEAILACPDLRSGLWI
jgi:xanthine dehydrogenase accessory factor